MLLEIAIGASAILISVKAYQRFSKGVCRSSKDMTGKVVIVTGSNCGIGLETARDLAKRKARVILACRDVTKGERAKRDILNSIGQNGGDDVRVMQLDLSSMESVHNFARHFLESESRLDVLVNNAAILPNSGKTVTSDGFDLMTATNFLGPFLLTNLLLPALKSSAPSRIINLSSELHRWGQIDLNDVRGLKHEGNGMVAYGGTKLAVVLMSLQLSEMLKGRGVTSNSVHPGLVSTNLLVSYHDYSFVYRLIYRVMEYFTKTPKDGAQTSIYLAVSDDVEGVSGRYFKDCAPSEPLAIGTDFKMAESLWKAAAQLLEIE